MGLDAHSWQSLPSWEPEQQHPYATLLYVSRLDAAVLQEVLVGWGVQLSDALADEQMH